MVDPVSVFSAVTGGLQLLLQLRSYFNERRARRQEQHEHQITSSSPLPVNYFQNNYYYPTHTTINQNFFLLPYAPSPPDLHNPASVWLGGRIVRVVPQEAPHNAGFHGRMGMRTGGQPVSYLQAVDHWNCLQRGHSPGAIAVVDWTKGNIDMFVQAQYDGVYYRNYRVQLSTEHDVAVFADKHIANQIFSGEISQKKLTRCNTNIAVVGNLDDGIRSTNSWTRLGIYDDNVPGVEYDEPVFMRIVRGAVFGLVCCLYESPCEINVDMDTECHRWCDIVRINTDRELSTLVKRDNCCFSVFSFNTQGWATQDILIG